MLAEFQLAVVELHHGVIHDLAELLDSRGDHIVGGSGAGLLQLTGKVGIHAEGVVTGSGSGFASTEACAAGNGEDHVCTHVILSVGQLGGLCGVGPVANVGVKHFNGGIHIVHAVDVTDQEVVDSGVLAAADPADDLIGVDVGIGGLGGHQSGQSAGHESQGVLIGSEGSDVLALRQGIVHAAVEKDPLLVGIHLGGSLDGFGDGIVTGDDYVILAAGAQLGQGGVVLGLVGVALVVVQGGTGLFAELGQFCVDQVLTGQSAQGLDDVHHNVQGLLAVGLLAGGLGVRVGLGVSGLGGVSTSLGAGAQTNDHGQRKDQGYKFLHLFFLLLFYFFAYPCDRHKGKRTLSYSCAGSPGPER